MQLKQFAKDLRRLLIPLLLGWLSLSAVQAKEIITYYHNDALGSPIAATDEQGKVIWREEYTPYGERLLREAQDREQVGYTGKPEEVELGLTYFGARWYDPHLGRFLSPDPVPFQETNPHSFNRYAYGNANPYKFVDPDGNAPVLVPIIVGTLLELGNLAYEAYDTIANPCGDCVKSSGISFPSGIGSAATKAAGKVARTVAGKAAKNAPIRWGPHNGPGPLGEKVASTFRGGSYTELVTTEPTTLHRVYGGKAGELGPYWTQTPPSGPLQSRIDSALLPRWGNTAEEMVTLGQLEIVLPQLRRMFSLKIGTEQVIAFSTAHGA